jgi:1-deoxy-11beta-hydroxypentalenate dehydrogenase
MRTVAVLDSTADDWAAVLGVNLHGVVHVAQTFVPRLLAQGRPAHLVVTGSIAGLAPPLASPVGVYAASKSAVVAVAEYLDAELAGTDVAVSVVCPAGVDTAIFGATPLPPGLMPPAEAARRILDGVRAGRFYVFTHSDEVVRGRLDTRWVRVRSDLDDAAASPGDATPRGDGPLGHDPTMQR